MLFCSNCGTQLSEGLNFCTNCGTRLVKTTAAEGNAAVQQPIQTAPVQAEPAQTTERVQPSEPAQNPAQQMPVQHETVVSKKIKSEFDGGLLQLIGWMILGFLITIFTVGICYPWAFTMIYRWETKHTVINGKRLAFDGTALQLFGTWIKWFILTLITCGIYGFWLPIKLKKWKVKHTYFAGQKPSAGTTVNDEISVAKVAKVAEVGEDELLCAYITGSQDQDFTNTAYIHYKQAFDKISQNGSKVGWNWGACLCTIWNLMYRKSYGMGLILAIPVIVVTFIPAVGQLLPFLIVPLFADYIHYKRYQKALDEAKHSYPDDILSQKSFLAKEGGVNKSIIGIAIAFVVIVGIICAAFLPELL